MKKKMKQMMAIDADKALPPEIRGKGADVSESDLKDLEKMQDKNVVQLSRFHLRLRRSGPTQVMRYSRDAGAAPLWPSVTHAPEHTARTVPPCPRCGAPRTFEFQILPQIINHLKVDSELHSAADFGSAAVYTCSKSCAPPDPGEDGCVVGLDGDLEVSGAYAEEVVLVHPPLNA